MCVVCGVMCVLCCVLRVVCLLFFCCVMLFLVSCVVSLAACCSLCGPPCRFSFVSILCIRDSCFFNPYPLFNTSSYFFVVLSSLIARPASCFFILSAYTYCCIPALSSFLFVVGGLRSVVCDVW